jgi:site-specific recombinase
VGTFVVGLVRFLRMGIVGVVVDFSVGILLAR